MALSARFLEIQNSDGIKKSFQSTDGNGYWLFSHGGMLSWDL